MAKRLTVEAGRSRPVPNRAGGSHQHRTSCLGTPCLDRCPARGEGPPREHTRRRGGILPSLPRHHRVSAKGVEAVLHSRLFQIAVMMIAFIVIGFLIEADLAMKRKALSNLHAPPRRPFTCQASDRLLEFLRALRIMLGNAIGITASPARQFTPSQRASGEAPHRQGRNCCSFPSGAMIRATLVVIFSPPLHASSSQGALRDLPGLDLPGDRGPTPAPGAAGPGPSSPCPPRFRPRWSRRAARRSTSRWPARGRSRFRKPSGHWRRGRTR